MLVSDFMSCACRKAADWIEDVTRTEGIECKFVRVPGYLYPAKDSWIHNKTLEKELEVQP